MKLLDKEHLTFYLILSKENAIQTNTKIAIADRLRSHIFFKLYKTYISDSILIVRNEGFKELLKRKGWKFLAVIVLYYLIRDSIIYIIIPVLIVKGVIE